MKTTAIYLNRIKNRNELFSLIPINEFGDSEVYFLTKNGVILCNGYDRIVFGDHGPYIEFNKSQICNTWIYDRKNIGFYNKLYPVDKTKILLYEQLKTVSNLPNPPKGKRSFRGNRLEGYADYKIGKFYISPYEPELQIVKSGIVLNKNQEKSTILNEILEY